MKDEGRFTGVAGRGDGEMGLVAPKPGRRGTRAFDFFLNLIMGLLYVPCFRSEESR
jgi:hypothetical protein